MTPDVGPKHIAGPGLRSLVLETEYRTGDSDLLTTFYGPCLSRSISYDRAVGFFRSTLFAVAAQAIVDFAKRGGRARLICSPDLTEEDIRALESGYADRERIVAAALDRELQSILADAGLTTGTEILATLVATNSLDLKVAVRPPASGIYHEKLGIFKDAVGALVTFRGSSNETWSGWHTQGNLESFEVFCSWWGESDAIRAKKHEAYFDQLWQDRVPHVNVMTFPEVVRTRLLRHSKSDLHEFSGELLERQAKPVCQQRAPQPHQLLALANWRAQGARGTLEHATGSGKTFTALLAVSEHLKGGGVSLILVPSRLLLEQWHQEIIRELGQIAVLKVGAGHNAWREPDRLERFSTADPQLGSRVILATMQTASTPEFLERLTEGLHLFLVADEVHQLGSPRNREILGLETGKRLGLSATPTRYGDSEGTRLLLEYFGGIVPPPFTLNDAILVGRLVPYEYHPHVVEFTPEEDRFWKALTLKIAREIAAHSSGDGEDRRISERARLLLIKRARIAKKAAGKTALAVSVLRGYFEPGQRWLVYCEDSAQLQAVLLGLRAAEIDAWEYHTKMLGDPPATLRRFMGDGGVLVAIRCLDEGVDLPALSHALILASSQNPRQFIQRRGRVLRRAPGKDLAIIHDALVTPTSAEALTLGATELRRALEFAQSALNRTAGVTIRDIGVRLGIDVDSLVEDSIEEEE